MKIKINRGLYDARVYDDEDNEVTQKLHITGIHIVCTGKTALTAFLQCNVQSVEVAGVQAIKVMDMMGNEKTIHVTAPWTKEGEEE